MSCLVKRSEEGLVTGVVLENGQPSQLFNKINSNVFVPDSEVALNIYSNAYSDKFEQGEPELLYKDIKGNVYDNIEEIILNDSDGLIELGFSDGEEFTAIASFDTQKTEYSKFLSSQIKQGLLSTEKIVDEDGQTYLSGKGTLSRTKTIAAKFVKDNMQDQMVALVTVRQDGAIKVKKDSEYTTVNTKKGETLLVSKEDLGEVLKRKDILDKPNLILEYENLTNRSFKEGTVRPTDKTKLYISNLKSFLNSLGFSATSLEAYSKAFNNRHGKDPDVSALIDLANRIVAISEGGNQMELISEEVAHLAVETYNDQASILGAITDIHLTPEYAEYAETYRQKYSKQYEGVALEEAVRKEILGKVIAKAILNNTQMSEEVSSLWQKFIAYIQSIFKPAHRRALDRLSEQISQDILANNLSSFSLSNLKGEGVFYSVDNEGTTKAINSAIKVLDALSKKVKGTNRVAVTSRVKEIDESATVLVELEHINDIQRNIRTNLNIIQSKLNSQDVNAGLTAFDISTFTTIQEQLTPIIGEYMDYIERNVGKMSPQEKAVAESLKKDLSFITEEIAKMSSSVNKNVEDNFKKDLEAHLDNNYELSEEERDKVINSALGVQKDTSSLSSFFGIFSNSSNTLKNFVGSIVQRMYSSVNKELQAKLNPVLNKIFSNGLDKFQKEVIMRDKDGKQTYYYDNGVNLHEHDQNKINDMAEVIKRLLPDTDIEVAKKAVETRTVSEILITQENKNEYAKELEKWKAENNEQLMPEDYYIGKQTMEEYANMSDESKYEIRGYRAQIHEILNTTRGENGKVDKSKLNPEQKIALEQLQRALATKRSPIDQNGNVYEGLRLVEWADLTQAEKDAIPFSKDEKLDELLSDYKGKFTVLKEGSSLDDLSPDARLALDMFNINTVMRLKAISEGKSFDRDASNELIEELKRLEDAGDVKGAYELLRENSTVGFTDEYYDTLDNGSPTYIDDAQAEIDLIEDDNKRATKQALLDDLKELLTRKREITKQYRKLGDVTEIAMNDMTSTVQQALLDIESQIATKRRSLAIKRLTESEAKPITEKTVSNTYRALQVESGEDIFEFAQRHMTQDNKTYLFNFEKYLRDNLINNIDTEVKEEFEDFINEQFELGGVRENDDAQSAYKKLREAFAESRLASYAFSYKVQAFTDLQAELQEGLTKPSELFTNREDFPALKYMNFNIDYEWSTSGSGTNPYFLNAYGKEVPKFSKYKNSNFFAKYGIGEKEYVDAKGDLTLLEAKTNQQAFEVLKEMIKINKLVNENTSDNTNIYLRPQISRGLYEKAKSTATKLNPKQAWIDTKDSVLDSISYRADEKEYGETINGQSLKYSGIKVPPRMFQNKLEQPELLTEDVLFAASMALKESLLYKGRIENIDKVNLVIRHAKNSEFQDGAIGAQKNVKKGEVSRVVKDLIEYADNHLYGIKQTRQLEFNVGGRTVDLTKTVKTLQSLSSSFNLKYNPFVAATSLTTGLYNNFQNWIVGDDMHKSSYKLAVSSLSTDIAKYFPDSGKVNRTSRLSVRMEGFGLTDVADKVENAKDTFLERNALRLGHMLDRIANLPVVPRVLYTVLKDTRLSDGKFVSFNQFTTQQKNKNKDITKSEIESLWKKLEGETFDTFLDEKDGVLKANSKFFDKGFTEENFNDFVLTISEKTKQLVQVVDGQLNEADRVMAQRDVALNLLMQHKGWLPINMYRMFKSKHFNFAQGKFEQGYYRTAFALAYEMVKRYKNPSSIKEYYNDLSVGDKKNLKRVLVHAGMMMSVLGAILALNASDDDDDSFLEDFARYIAYRTYGEINSVTPMGMYRSVKDTAKQPFVVLSSYEKWTEIPMSVFASEEGAFVDAINKGTPLKRIEQLQDLDATLSTWKRFNDDNISLIKYFEGED